MNIGTVDQMALYAVGGLMGMVVSIWAVPVIKSLLVDLMWDLKNILFNNK